MHDSLARSGRVRFWGLGEVEHSGSTKEVVRASLHLESKTARLHPAES